MAELQTNPEGSNTVGDSKERQDASRDVLQSTTVESFIPTVNEGEVQRKPKGKIWGGKFGLLLWKNYLLQKNNPIDLATQIIIIPLLFIPLLLVIKRRDIYLVSFPLFLILSFIYPVSNICKSIVHEKERRLKESMKMMGLSNWLHWSAWLAQSLILLGITATIITLGYKLPLARDRDGEPRALFNRIEWSVLLALLMSYMFSSITFAFLVASFCSKSTSSTTACSLLFFLSYPLLLYIGDNYERLPMLLKLACRLIHNFEMGWGAVVMAANEFPGGETIQWTTMGNAASEYHYHRVSKLVLDAIPMLILDGFLYLFLAVYIEAVFPGEFGVPLPFYYPLMPSYWCGSGRSSGKVNPEHSSQDDDTGFFEKEPEDLNAGIQIKGLKKVFGHKVAVDGLTLNFYEDQVTALLGHNGSGKTTTMSMLTGLYPPSSGTALVNGFDIRKDMKSVHGSLGLCPQHDVLFDDLTVEEHLKFFCLLKGYALPMQPEIDRMLVALNLEDKRDAESKTLSGGMKRKLSVGIALVGGSKVVLLDEPTAGLDPGARRSIWDLISGEKQGRTIVLSTHFMDEADLLGDRIAILALGKAACCGSSLFLKQKYGGGYHLTMVKEPNCKVNVITELLQKYLSEVVVDQNVGTELSYSLPDKKVSMFPQMFEELEKRKAELGVASYGCSITQMEEVFMRVGQQVEAGSQLKQADQTNQANLTGNQSAALSSLDLNVPKSQLSTRNIELVNNEPSQSQSLRNTQVILKMNNESEVKMEESPPSRNVKSTGSALKKQQLRAMLVKKWIYTKRNKFTYILLAVLPVGLFSLVLLAPTTSLSASNELEDPLSGSKIASILAFTMSFYAASFILFPIKEREVNSKHLQFVSGVPTLTFWLGHFLYDMGFYLIICILLTFGWTAIGNWQSVLAFFLLLISYGWAVIPMAYVFSFVYSAPATGYIKTAFLYLILGSIATSLAEIRDQADEDNPSALLFMLRLPIRFIPNFNLNYGTQKIGNFSQPEKDLFAWGDLYSPPRPPKHKPGKVIGFDETPETTISPFTGRDLGIGQHLFYLFITGLISIGMLRCIESPSGSYGSPNANVGDEDPTVLEDSDVAAENERIRNGNLEELSMSETLVVKNLTKYFGKFVAVDHVCLGVQHGECFGLLGVNGAGKTTVFKMLTGDIPISSGAAFVSGMSVLSNTKDVHKVIGYCPQFDGLIPELTGRETIRMFARLRGIRELEIDGVVDMLAADLLLSEHVEKPCGTYSGGNKRKLSTAISLIGNPSMIFLDEPTAGMDPVARRYLWNTIIKVREAGSSVVLTSHSMEECEALCTRLAIMVNGKFRCLGSTQHLKNKFGDGYTLIAQMQPSKMEQPQRTSNQKRTSLETGRKRQSLNAPPEPWEVHLQPLRNFIEKNFSDCQLKDEHPCYVHYHIPMGSISWAQMFKKMEEAKALFLLEAYSIGQTSLEQIFLGFAKGQYNADD